MGTNNGRRILEERLTSTPSYGNFNSNIDKLLILSTGWKDGKLERLLQKLDSFIITISKLLLNIFFIEERADQKLFHKKKLNSSTAL